MPAHDNGGSGSGLTARLAEDCGEVPGARAGLGYRGIPQDQVHEAREPEVVPGTRSYMATGGLVDRIGGSRRRMFGKKRFMRLLDEIAGRPMPARKACILDALQAYQGEQLRRDDVLTMGFRNAAEDAASAT